MKTWRFVLVGGFLMAAMCPSLLRAQQPPMPKPGAEQEALKQFEGDWDATVNFMGNESKGTANYRMGYGGFWLTEEFKGDAGGQAFEGRGTTGYDPFKKKYVGTWIDSMSPTIMAMEGNYENDGKRFTGTGTTIKPDGTPMKMKSVYDIKDKDNFVFTMYDLTDGKEQEMMKITYQRKK
jgi:hypothetical protein